MSKSLLIFSHDFQINMKKIFKAHDVHMIDINANLMNNVTHKNYKLMSELVKCLFTGNEKLTLITNFVPKKDFESMFDVRSLAFIFKENDLKDTYELNDFYAAVKAHIISHALLVESEALLRKELVSSQLCKATSSLKTLKLLMNDYDTLIKNSKYVFDSYREDFVLKFGIQP